ncbi:Heavy metal transport/detoxification superfamily protein [Striga hermonthica]|uniref:Heavy metal transport/detoxification superfamily protein n=1 Tax=Striga hermonthica TaxID=68872 RepID=A0A9N7NFT6_STRHE|nr:Heavy metal transport/detoxification superfamily protein [Striga hermonthica]
MGEKDVMKGEGEKKPAVDGGEKEAAAADGGEKKEAEPLTVVLKLDLHCEGCAKKVSRSISHLQGVEKVKADRESRKLTVTGSVDPTWLRQTVENKTKKKVELISPQPKKDGGDAAAAAALKPPEKDKAVDNDKKPKEVVINTVVMKIKLHCDGCAHKIKRIILKNIDGVSSVSTDFHKDLVTVIGSMDVKGLVSYLREKLKREVEIIPPKKSNNNDEKSSKQKEEVGEGHVDPKKEKPGGKIEKEGGKPDAGDDAGDDGGERNDKEAVKGEKNEENRKKDCEPEAEDVGGETKKEKKKKGKEVANKVELNKMDRYYNYNPHTYYYEMPVHDRTYSSHEYGSSSVYHDNRGFYSDSNFAGQYARAPPLPPPTYLNANDGLFSDENPNGCYVM